MPTIASTDVLQRLCRAAIVVAALDLVVTVTNDDGSTQTSRERFRAAVSNSVVISVPRRSRVVVTFIL